jgi:hypothetical protein
MRTSYLAAAAAALAVGRGAPREGGHDLLRSVLARGGAWQRRRLRVTAFRTAIQGAGVSRHSLSIIVRAST